MVRLSVGIEAAGDIIADLAQALRASQKVWTMQLVVDGADAFAASGGRDFQPDLPVVVFIHGAGLDHSVWALHSRWFAYHGFSVLAVDLPGHGKLGRSAACFD